PRPHGDRLMNAEVESETVKITQTDADALTQTTPRPEAPAPNSQSVTQSIAVRPLGTDDLRRHADAAGRAAIAEVDFEALPTAMRQFDVAGLLVIAATVHELGGLPKDTIHTANQVAEAMGVAARHRPIVRRWLEILTAEQLLVRDEDGRYRGLRAPTQEECTAADAALDGACAVLGYSAELISFFRVAIQNLPKLLRDEVMLQALLFPEGEIATALGLYQDNTINRYLNAAVAEVVRRAAEKRATTLRVLELGAGVGGTTATVLSSLVDQDVDYLFTDVSRFFLITGQERFGDHPRLRYALVDINGELPGQGIPEGKTDVVIAVNVAHNAHHVGRLVAGLRRLLTPDGLLVMIEGYREYYQIMTSLRFLMSPQPGQLAVGLTDVRAGSDRIFLTRKEWLAELHAAGLRPLLDLPDPHGDPLAALAQCLFVATPANLARTDP
ncbi:MAG: class I SAM-dependent methyltransferase, partial [Pseudonocardiaceae bacterium]